ncbi:MAG: HDIG domain-containing protein, partial [Clostridia bacterium]|nr:HDIG domain-containing protein [Clostridia bacterium]
EALTELVVRHVSAYLRPNMLVDVETTEANRQKAEDSVEPIMYLKGRNIVRSGEIITQAQIVMLENLGMLADTTTVDVLIYLGVALLLLMVFVMLLAYMLVFEKNMWRNTRTVGLLCVILLVTVGACALLLNINQFLMPVTIGVMLTALLIRPRFAFVVNAALAVIVGMLNSGASGSFSTSLIVVMMTTLVSGTLCVILLNGKTQRLMVLLSGILVSGSNMLTTLAVGLITDANPPSLLSWAMWTAASGLLAAVLCIGLQPALEWVFNLITSAKLMELSNPNHPLIRRMILEASGTYHHSIIVANLAEAAADAIGANGLLARVGAYYHDIGKLKRPLYFKENQIGDNPHDRTDPLVSAAILTAHPTDGVELAMKYRMPKEILDIIQQHHGDTPVMYFYGQSVQREGAENVDINDFRYPGPRPQTKEAAVVMMADTVEAAARTAANRTSDGMEKLIRKLIRDKIDDGQLNQSPMTLEDIENVTRAFVTVLSGVFHQRIEYPDLKIPTRKDKKAKADSGAAGEKGEKAHA